MANPYFLGVDLSIPTYTWSAGVNSSYPVSNLATYIITDVSKSNATTDLQYLLIDMGSAVACNTCIVDGINFSATDAVISLEYNTNDDTNWADALPLGTFDEAVDLAQVIQFGSVTKRYYRLLYTKGSALTVAPQVGNIFIGTRTAFDSTYEWDFARGNKEYETQESTSLNGLIRMSQSFAGRKRWDLVFRLQSNTFKSSFDTFIDTVRGKLRPFYFVDVDSVIYYVHLDEDYNDVRGYRYNMNNFQIQLKSQTVS